MSTENPVIAIVDVETTGKNPDRDQIIEFAVQKGLEEGAYVKSWRVKPSIPISPDAQAVHGISNEDVADCPPFSSLAGVVRKVLEGAEIIAGYNVSFDLRVIQAEFRRAQQPMVDLSKKIIVDPLAIWRSCEPRRLEDAVRRFAGREHEGAHAAAADVTATGQVLLGMIKSFGLEQKSWKEIADFSNLPDSPGSATRGNWIGPTHHIQWQNGVPVIGFGKHKGRPIADLARDDDGYLAWVLQQDFAPHVKEIIGAAQSQPAADFVAWVREQFGSPS